MENIYLEHANITFNNLSKAVDFFKTAFPDFKERGSGVFNGRKWIHLGTDTSYLALNQAVIERSSDKDYGSKGINHLGFVVENIKELSKRLLAAGYKRDYPTQHEEFRIREYFLDTEGNEYEFVQYLSDKPEEMNKY